MSIEAVLAALAVLGPMLLQSLLNALTNTITNVATDAMTGAIGGVSEAIKSVFGANNFLSGVVDDFASNLEQSLNSNVAGLTNGLNQTAQTALGISNAQQALSAQLSGITEGLLDGVNQKLALEQTQQHQTGAVLTDYLLRFVSGKRSEMETFGAYLAEQAVDSAGGEAIISLRGTDLYYQQVMGYLEADLSFVEGRAVELNTATYNALMDQVTRNTKEFKDWFRETVVIPIANYNAMVSALKVGFNITSEDVKIALGEMSIATYEYQLERLEKGEIAPGIKVDMSTEGE
jgi:hypothetical protein